MMIELKQVRYGNGSVRFFAEVEPTPTTSETHGNVTVNNMGKPGSPARYEVTYMISSDFEMEGVEVNNVFHWTVALTGVHRDDPYAGIEAAGARQLAPMLRAVADQIEKEVAEFDAELAAKEAD
jgi:hypothetical protein